MLHVPKIRKNENSSIISNQHDNMGMILEICTQQSKAKQKVTTIKGIERANGIKGNNHVYQDLRPTKESD